MEDTKKFVLNDKEEEHFIDASTYKDIDDKIKKIIREKTSIFPVPIEEIIKASGDINIVIGKLPLMISGKIERTETNPEKHTITVNEDHHPNRQRFTMAHEFAHYLLHKSEIGDGFSENILYRSDTNMGLLKEVQANRLAAKLLMPLELINELAGKYNNLSLIAEDLEVSILALKIRLGIADQ